jgi:hypothetical protein
MLVIGKRSRETRGGSRLDVRALVAFFALAYALSWSWVIPWQRPIWSFAVARGWPTKHKNPQRCTSSSKRDARPVNRIEPQPHHPRAPDP